MTVLRRDTFNKLPNTLLCFAINQDKTNQLVQATRTALKKNFDIRDSDLDDIKEGRQAFPPRHTVLQEGDEIGHYEINMVQWARGRFREKSRIIVYGNCPQCFTALPRGHTCDRTGCDGLASSDLYFVQDSAIYFNRDDDRNDGPCGALINTRSGRREKAEPNYLSKLVRRRPKIYLDWGAYERKNGQCDPNFGGHWYCLSISHVLTEISRCMSFDTLGVDPEEMLIRSLQATRRDVEMVCDRQHQIFPAVVRIYIRTARRIYDRNHSVYRALNPFEQDLEDDDEEE